MSHRGCRTDTVCGDDGDAREFKYQQSESGRGPCCWSALESEPAKLCTPLSTPSLHVPRSGFRQLSLMSFYDSLINDCHVKPLLKAFKHAPLLENSPGEMVSNQSSTNQEGQGRTASRRLRISQTIDCVIVTLTVHYKDTENPTS